jgi:hypothetical protein
MQAPHCLEKILGISNIKEMTFIEQKKQKKEIY